VHNCSLYSQVTTCTCAQPTAFYTHLNTRPQVLADTVNSSAKPSGEVAVCRHEAQDTWISSADKEKNTCKKLWAQSRIMLEPGNSVQTGLTLNVTLNI